jgi:hypothetical protein
MKEIILTYVVIVIIQLLYTIYVPIDATKKSILLDKHLINTSDKELEANKFIEEKLRIIIGKADKMNYSEWLEYVRENSEYEFDGQKIYIFGWKYVEQEKMVLEVYPDKNLQGLSWSDFYSQFKNIILDARNTISTSVPYTMYEISNENEFDFSTYYWIDPLYEQSVRKKSVFTKYYFEKENKKGIIGMGYNVQNLTFETQYKNFTYIEKIELAIGSLISLVIAIVISKLHTVKSPNLKAFCFLLFSNLFILFYVNTQGHISKVSDENKRITSINANILNLSFLSSVNLFILSTIYSTDKDLFVETSVIFSMTVLLLMIASYKNTSQNSIFDLIGTRVTNTFIFNYAVALNLLIMGNFIFYAFSKSFK